MVSNEQLKIRIKNLVQQLEESIYDLLASKENYSTEYDDISLLSVLPQKNPELGAPEESISTQEIEPAFDFTSLENLEIMINEMVVEPEAKPITKEEILLLSHQYQNEWRFEREKKLIEHALNLYPDWDYVHTRLEWHARPLFHPDPQKSKMQPRKPLHLDRDPAFIPLPETINSLCFVTASSSNAPYFKLVIELIESIKATRFYHHVPIKIFDCGLTPEDQQYLIERFNVEILDPGFYSYEKWIISDSNDAIPKNGFKGIMSRPYMHKHFPGYNYYFWIDADTWIQDDTAIDKFVCLAEKQGIGIAKESLEGEVWSYDIPNMFIYSIPLEFHELLIGKKAMIPNLYCINLNMLEAFRVNSELALEKLQAFKWGFDLAVLNYTFYQQIPNGVIFEDRYLNDVDKIFLGAHIDENKNLLLNTNSSLYLGFIGLENYVKTMPHVILFANDISQKEMDAIRISRYLMCKDLFIAEEAMHKLCVANGWKKGSYFYRQYPEPSPSSIEISNS